MNETVAQILLVLLHRPGSAGAILDAIAEIDGGREPSLATFYRHLSRACESGWVEVLGPEDPGSGPGRPRHSYRISDTGRERVVLEAERLQRLARVALASGDGE